MRFLLSLLLLSLSLIAKLSSEEIDESGTWWSFQPLAKVTPPGPVEPAPINPIDTFVHQRLLTEKLKPSPPANLRTLARRVTFDLSGLPPSPERIEKLLKDSETDVSAYEKYVDDLLASTSYGERWARHWLDVARYGESNGFEYNEARRNAWPYRDWVIGAMNKDMPYDEFARLQIAGDVTPGITEEEGTAAVGFLVAGVHNTVLGSNDLMKKRARADELEEMVGTVSQAFLGVTAQCSRCHDHKVDPIPTEDYYRLTSSLSGAWHGELNFKIAGKPMKVHTVISRAPGTTSVHQRGDPANPGEEVVPGGIAAIQGPEADFELDNNSGDADRRLKLAEWTAAPSNPLFAWVIVNRVWHYHFGKGIVDTPSDFGRMGGRPSHPDLLDWLAGWFCDNGYSLKKLHRLIVTSASYRQSSKSQPESMARDRESRLLWRFPPQRVEGEVLRDSMLTVAGVLNRKMGGPGYEDTREEHFNAGRYFHPIDPEGPEFQRRTIYRFSPRGGRGALLDSFDCPDPSATAPRRNVTTTPLQALSLQNNKFVWRMADAFARRLEKEAGSSVAEQVELAWLLAFCRAPDKLELELGKSLVEKHDLPALCRALFNSGEFILIE